MKILVVGFPRSGTTLTYRIFKSNPDVKNMIFERWILKQAKNKKELLRKFPVFAHTCGEKVIYAKRVTGKIGKSDETIVDYCLKWNNWFGDEARIVQIVRHPFDSLNSLLIKKSRQPRGPVFEKNYDEYLEYIPKYTLDIAELENCITIKYENLVSHPRRVIKKLYTHCGINNKHIHKEKMKTRRVLNHKRSGPLFKYNDKLIEVVDAFNTLPGIKYEVPHGM